MTENNTDAARAYRAIIVKRMDSHLSLKPSGEQHSEMHQFESAMSSWVANLQRAQEQDFFMMWRDGVIANAATVLGAEQVPARFYGGVATGREDGLIDVRFITSVSIPAWLESLIGTPFEMPNRNPVFYVTIQHDPVTGAVEVVR